MGRDDLDDLWLEDDGPLARRIDALWEQAEQMADAPPTPAKSYVTCPLAWLRRVRSLVCSVDQLLILMVLYRRCLMSRSRTVTLPNGELVALGISRYTKYRLLARLEEAGAATIEPRNGRAVRVTLHWFP